MKRRRQDDPGARPTDQPERDAGFTLLDTLLTLAILALGAALVAPRLNLIQGARSELDAAGVLADLKILRDDAMLKGVSTAFRATPGGYALEPARIFRRLRSGEVTITVPRRWDGVGNAGVVFYPDGSSSGGSIALTSAEKIALIFVDPFDAHAVRSR